MRMIIHVKVIRNTFTNLYKFIWLKDIIFSTGIWITQVTHRNLEVKLTSQMEIYENLKEIKWNGKQYWVVTYTSVVYIH